MVLVIYGAGGLGRDVLILARQIGRAGQAFWDEILFLDDVNPDRSVAGVPVISFERLLETHPPAQARVCIALGEPKYRRLLREKVEEAGYSLATLVHPEIHLEPDVRLEPGVVLPFGTYLGGNVTIETNSLVTPPSSGIGHDTIIGRDSVIGALTSVGGRCVVGSQTYVSGGVSVLDRVRIGDRTIVAMGSFVNKDIPDDMVAVGYPARPVKRNDEQIVFR